MRNRATVRVNNASGTGMLIVFLLVVAALVGEVKCIVKAFSCDWEPSYKAEAIYTASSLLGIGAIVGYMDFEDMKTDPKTKVITVEKLNDSTTVQTSRDTVIKQ